MEKSLVESEDRGLEHRPVESIEMEILNLP
jgi:hypothetical protein